MVDVAQNPDLSIRLVRELQGQLQANQEIHRDRELEEFRQRRVLQRNIELTLNKIDQNQKIEKLVQEAIDDIENVNQQRREVLEFEMRNQEEQMAKDVYKLEKEALYRGSKKGKKK